MHRYEYVRPADQAAAIAAAVQATTAQQGAEVRFLAGGTTLIDLMKLNVETPARVIDVNRLPLDRIEDASGGGVALVGEAFVGDALLDVVGLAGENQQRLVLRLPAEARNRPVVGADVHISLR